MSVRSRLDRLENRHDGPPRFPGWEILAGALREEDWLAAHGFADPLAALRAGVPGIGLGYSALLWWLESTGYSGPFDAETVGALPDLPPELKTELHMLPKDPPEEDPVEKRLRELEEKCNEEGQQLRGNRPC